MAIISFRHNFIFIKTVKTAGTSIEVDLSRVAGPDAIVTPILPEEDEHQPRNYLNASGRKQFYNHMTGQKIRDLLGRDTYDSMFKFCVEREPVAKCISQFHMLRNSPLHNPDGHYTASWEDFLAKGRFPIDIERYTDVSDGKRHLIVDEVLRYDQLEKELTRVLSQVGIEGFTLTTRAKSTYSQNRLVTVEQVTPDQRSLIYRAFRPSLDATGIDWSRATS
ncbi:MULTISPECIES: sulfotransferase family 2 domain-containing protein [Maricaulis]|uniref:Sulfotransferase family protein n=1 Tax=Maricaulis maris TaxID=74318 RepID=A0A495CY17_9PROT|nr:MULTISPECIES: sulfotransferase family 2 domain-containing protein [Maricaulis]RKQ94144.1 hypothetical protein C7435_3116 [Maricaulis maris]